jgi:hypothetical protein
MNHISNAKMQPGPQQPKHRNEADGKALAKIRRQKYKNRNFFDSIFLTAVFFLGSPGTGRGMRGRGIKTRRGCFSPFPCLSFLCQIFPKMNDFPLLHCKAAVRPAATPEIQPRIARIRKDAVPILESLHANEHRA